MKFGILAISLVALPPFVACWLPFSPIFVRPDLRLKSHNGRDNSIQGETVPLTSPTACLVGYTPLDQKEELTRILLNVGFGSVQLESEVGTGDVPPNLPVYNYKYVKASGMLKLMETSGDSVSQAMSEEAPRWIPVQSGEENVLVANGWSFLDPDESEPTSAFDVDAANKEGQYKPKWGTDDSADRKCSAMVLSSLGFRLDKLSSSQVLEEAENIPSPQSKKILLDGETDTPNIKVTANRYDFSGSVSDVEAGLFSCAVGGNPLFTTADLSPLTASSGWMSFSRPIAEDHIEHIHPLDDSDDRRVEVIDARSGCHLGHYFGPSEGYCINASALTFTPVEGGSLEQGRVDDNMVTYPTSWHQLQEIHQRDVKSKQILKSILMQKIQNQQREILLGAGCFWHVEGSLRRIPGVIDTKVGYAGGSSSFPSPSYKEVCGGQTNHAEVVKLVYDPNICDLRMLLDCFLAMHDPTVVRAHGKRAQKTGQYRSCIFVFDRDTERLAREAVDDCRKQLGKILSTEVRLLPASSETESESFWIAEDKHQRHDERVQNKGVDDLKTMDMFDWLVKYSRRSSSIWGSGESIPIVVDDSLDDGMARMMI